MDACSSWKIRLTSCTKNSEMASLPADPCVISRVGVIESRLATGFVVVSSSFNTTVIAGSPAPSSPAPLAETSKSYTSVSPQRILHLSSQILQLRSRLVWSIQHHSNRILKFARLAERGQHMANIVSAAIHKNNNSHSPPPIWPSPPQVVPRDEWKSSISNVASRASLPQPRKRR